LNETIIKGVVELSEASMKKIETNRLGQEIIDPLTPEVGAIVAQAMLDKQCTLVGITPSTIRKDLLEVLAQRIEHVLVIFGHDGKAAGLRIRVLKDFGA
jgi:hypothetical protein